MAIKIGSNIASLNAQRRLGEVTSSLSRVFERLSSGQRINNPQDDAAGLAVSSTLNADIRVFTQAIRNVNDGTSVLSIAQQAVQQLSNINTRQSELAEQAANGVVSAAQRQTMNQEAAELTKEYRRILTTTKFNDQQLFQDNPLTIGIQAGNSNSQIINLTLGSNLVTSSSSVSGSKNISVDAGAAQTSTIDFTSAQQIPSYTIDLKGNYSYASGNIDFTNLLPAFQSSTAPDLNFTMGYNGASASVEIYDSNNTTPTGGTDYLIDVASMSTADDVATAVYSDIAGIITSTGLSLNNSGGSLSFLGDSAQHAVDITINDNSGNGAINSANYGPIDQANINPGSYFTLDRGDGQIVDYFYNVGGIGSAPSGSFAASYEINVGNNPTGEDVSQATMDALNSNEGGFFSVGGSSGTDFSIYVSSSNYYNIAGENFDTSDLKVSSSGSSVSGYDYFSFYDANNNPYYAYYTADGTNDPHAPGTGLELLMDFQHMDSATLASTTASALSGFSTNCNVYFTINNNEITLTNYFNGAAAPISPSGPFSTATVVTGRNSAIDVAANSISSTGHGLSTGERIQLTSSGGVPGGISTLTDYYAIKIDDNTFKLATSKANANAGTAIDILTTGSDTQTFTAYPDPSPVTTSLQVADIDLTSQSSARTAMDTLKSRQNNVQLELGTIGTYQSRLQTALANLQSTRIEYQAAYGRITDADIASDSATLVKDQILQQITTSILAHANQDPALVLKLLS